MKKRKIDTRCFVESPIHKSILDTQPIDSWFICVQCENETPLAYAYIAVKWDIVELFCPFCEYQKHKKKTRARHNHL